MRLFGLIGYPLSHSFSKKYFNEKFEREGLKDCLYENFPLENISELPHLIKSYKELKGLNVTIPYKQSVMEYLTDVSKEAKEIGAVNVIKVSRRLLPSNPGVLIGYNTDAWGFEQSLKPLLQSHHTKALVLGTGGASKAIAYVLNKLGIEFSYVSRKQPGDKTILYDRLNADAVYHHKLIINTTPLGTFPDIQTFPPIPYEGINRDHLLYDLVYNPEETLFLQKGKEKGAAVKNGLSMLQLQAEKSWEIWTSANY